MKIFLIFIFLLSFITSLRHSFSSFGMIKNKQNQKLRGTIFNQLKMRVNEGINEIKWEKVDVPVKRVYVDNYSLYDLAPLIHSSSKDSKGLYDYFIDFKGEKIVFEFCRDISSDTCQDIQSQVALKSNISSLNCTPLSSEISNGNIWNIYKKNNSNNNSQYEVDNNKNDILKGSVNKGNIRGNTNGKSDKNNNNKEYNNDGNLINIKVNKNNKNTGFGEVEYILECDSKLENYKNEPFKFIEEKSTSSLGTLKLYFRSPYACPKVDYFRIWKFIYMHKLIFSIIGGVIGIILSLIGIYFFKVSVFILLLSGFFAISTSLILPFIPSTISTFLLILFIVIIFLLSLSLSFLFLSSKHTYTLPIGSAVIIGYILSILIFSVFAYWGIFLSKGRIWFWVGVLGLSILLSLLSLPLKKSFVIFAIVAGSASMAAISLSLIIGGLPNFYILGHLAAAGETMQVKKMFTWKVFLYLSCFFILVFCGTTLQLYINKKIKKDNKGGKDSNNNRDVEEEEEPLNK